MPENDDRKKLFAKLLAVQGNAKNVPKNGVNRSQGYKYVRAEDVVNAVRPLLAQYGLVVTMSATEHKRERYDRVNKQGEMVGSSCLSDVTVVAIVTDPDTGHSESFTFYGTGFDTTDKAVYKAITGAIKYAYLSLMNVSAGDDPEDDGENHGDNGGKQPSQPHNKPTMPPRGHLEIPLPGENQPQPGGRGKIIAEIAELEEAIYESNMSARKNARKKYGLQLPDGTPTDSFTDADHGTLQTYKENLEKRSRENGD